ncbi:MAG: tail fiber protein, partial [Bacteroidota bacterium]
MSLNADIGTITMFAGDFAPLNWAFCNGQILPISQAPELYAIIGTRYGGDGQTSFALPDMRGRAPIRKGTTPGENRNYFVGESGGEREVILGIDELPEHTHDNSGRTNVKAVLK